MKSVGKHNTDYEKYVLGSLILESDLVEEAIMMGLSKETFWSPAHQMIWEGIIAVHNSGQGLDELTMFDWLASTKNQDGTAYLDLIGGPQYFSDLTVEIQAVLSHIFQPRVQKLLEMADGRKLIKSCSEAINIAQEEKIPVEERISRVEGLLLDVRGESVRNEIKTLSEGSKQILENIQRVNRGEMEAGLLTGYPALDDVLGKLRPANMIVLAARPGLGKTSLAMNISENVASTGKKVLFFSLEMTREQLLERTMFSRAGVNARKMHDRILTQQDMVALDKAKRELDLMPIHVCDDHKMNILKLQSYARSFKKRNGLDLLVIDYLQLIKSVRGPETREQQIAFISNSLIGLGKELKIPMLVLAQPNRTSEQEKRWPRMSDIRESGATEQDAHIVFFISRVDKEGKELPREGVRQEVDIVVAKNRGWSTGSCKLDFIGHCTRFVDHQAKRLV